MSVVKFVFSKRFVRLLAISGLLAFLIVGGLWFYLRIITEHDEHVLVPDLKGKTVPEAEALLADLDLTCSVIDSVWNRDFEGGIIKEQVQEPMSEVKSGRVIYLTTFRSEPDTKIINIKEGDDQYVAQIKLKNIGVDFEVIFEANELLAGRVLRITQNDKRLEPGTSIKPGSAVKLYVGEQGNEKVAIPDLNGLTLVEAEKMLQLSNLSLGLPFYDAVVLTAEDSLNARVYQQSPRASDEPELKMGSSVDLWLSTVELLIDDKKGKKEAPPTKIDQ